MASRAQDEAFERISESVRDRATSTGRMPVAGDFGEVDLGRWVIRQRVLYVKGQLPIERIRRLESIPGWSWAPHERAFDDWVALLVAYAEENGDTRVPKTYVSPKGERLGFWVTRQRQLFRQRALARVHVRKLQNVRYWTWTTADFDNVIPYRRKHLTPPK